MVLFMRNYMKVVEGKRVHIVFYNDVKVRETETAFKEAMAFAQGDVNKVSLYKLPVNPGPWDRAGLVGHRRRGDILADIGTEQNPEELEWRESELQRLDNEYYAAGRDTIPMFEVGVAA